MLLCVVFGSPLAWPFVLGFVLAADGVLMVVLGTMAVLEVLYFILRFQVFTPQQMLLRTAYSLPAVH